MTASALEGLRVVELAHERCAWAGKLLADMGAEVIAVEPPRGSAQRGYEPFVDDAPDRERSLYWWTYNTSKLGVTLDRDTEQGRAWLRELIASADVLLEGEDPGTLASLGLDHETLSATHPELITVSITPFGSNGPGASDPATDITLMASGGLAWICGYDDHSLPPVRGTGEQAYMTACHYAVVGALVALVERDASGRGQHVDVNANAAVNVTTEHSTVRWLVEGASVWRQTGRHAGDQLTMSSQTACADGRWVNTGLPPRTSREYRILRDWIADLGLEEEWPEVFLLDMGVERESIDFSLIGVDEETTAIFGAAREALVLIASKLGGDDFFRQAQTRGLPIGIIYSPEEVLADPHFVDRGFPTPVEHPELGRTVTYPGAPYRFSATPWRIRRRAPQLGEDNARVLGDLGMSPEELGRLRGLGVV